LVKKWLAFACLSACALPAAADSRIVPAVAEDAKLYFTAPLRWDAHDWLHVGETLVVIGAAHQFDDDVRTHFVRDRANALDGRDPHSMRDAVPAAAILAGTWAAAFWQQSPDGYEEGREMIEAAGFSAVTTTLLKYATRRSRPNESADPNDWRASGDSFPSMHTSAAFAIGTVLAESGGDNHRWIRRFLGYGLAGATGYARLHDNVHWLSDTMAGAAVGIATARFVMRRGDARDRDSAFSVMPTDGGLMLTYNATF